MDKPLLYQTRLAHVMDAMSRIHLNGLVVSDPLSIWYLTGYYNEPYERLFVLYLDVSGHCRFFLNRLFPDPSIEIEKIWVTDAEDGIAALSAGIASHGIIGIDKQWPARFLIPLVNRTPEVRYVLGSDCVDTVRARKDTAEQNAMREASRVNDACMEAAAAYLKVGMTEKELAEYIDSRFLSAGASGPSFTTIVSFGKNAADPHHVPDNTIICEGDCVLIDMGCVLNRYCSDMTRTYFFKKIPDRFARIHDIVRTANEKAEHIVKPGVLFADIDAAARDYIALSGYGDRFTHRLGHFIGLSEHEQGDVSPLNLSEAKIGMVFSIEPGIYLEGQCGVRIEDLVLVTENGCEILNGVDKHLKIIG